MGRYKKPPISSWCAMDIPVTLARRGSGRRPSGGRNGGGGRPIGEEIVHRRCHHRYFYNTPGLKGQKSERGEELEAGLLRTEGHKEARFSGVAVADRVRLGMRTGVVAASGPKALTRTDGAK